MKKATIKKRKPIVISAGLVGCITVLIVLFFSNYNASIREEDNKHLISLENKVTTEFQGRSQPAVREQECCTAQSGPVDKVQPGSLNQDETQTATSVSPHKADVQPTTALLKIETNSVALDKKHKRMLLNYWLFDDEASFFRYIEDNRIDVNVRLSGTKPLRVFHLAVKMGPKAIDRVIRLGAEIDQPDFSIVHYAASGNYDIETFKHLMDLPQVDIHRLNSRGLTAFLSVVQSGQDEKAVLLLERGANFRQTDSQRNDALDLLSQSAKGKISTYDLLFDYGFVPEERHMANQIKMGKVDIVKHLFKKGGNLHFSDDDGNDALDLALSRSGTPLEMIRYLHSKGFTFSQKHLETARRNAAKKLVQTRDRKTGKPVKMVHPNAKKVLAFIESEIR